MTLPHFDYHPDPIGTCSIISSNAKCSACGQARGYIYDGPMYTEPDDELSICPWCIADGTAHRLFDAAFTDLAGIGGYGDWVEIPDKIAETVAYRTPGFSGWQQERWFTHCGDAAAFLGAAGCAELEQLGTHAVAAIQEESGLSGKDWEDYYNALNRDGSPTAYIFRCRHCGAFGGYSDFD